MTWTAMGLVEDFRTRRLSVSEVTHDLLDRIDRLIPVIGGVAAVDPDRVLAAAGAADRRLRAGHGRSLEGVPFTVKDWIDAEGWPILGEDVNNPHRRPNVDATAVARLRAAGGIVIVISSTFTDHAVHGPTWNPYDLTRAPGTSSSGAAALVAAGAAPLALASDSGGSIRLPAAWCGVAGMKPTFGRVPLTGHFPRCGALEDGRTVIGPMARTIADLAAVLPIIAGPDGYDAGVVPVPFGDPATVDVSSLRVGYVGDGPVTTGVQAMAAAGATCIDMPALDVRDEALELTLRYWNREELNGSDNLALLQDWDSFRSRLLAVTADIDVAITPAVTEPAPPWRKAIPTDYVWTLPWNLTGAPAITVPIGLDNGLPIAVQVIGQPWQDHIALAVAQAIEAAVPALPIATPLP